MNLRDRLEGILGDYVTDPDERIGLLNQTMYFIRKNNKQTAAIAFMLGVATTVGILRYFA